MALAMNVYQCHLAALSPDLIALEVSSSGRLCSRIPFAQPFFCFFGGFFSLYSVFVVFDSPLFGLDGGRCSVGSTVGCGARDSGDLSVDFVYCRGEPRRCVRPGACGSPGARALPRCRAGSTLPRAPCGTARAESETRTGRL
jgi:hypothetical protein